MLNYVTETQSTIINSEAIFLSPEYIALLISVMAICINVYISWENRKHNLAKEEYFKLKQVAEKIIAKLSILETHRTKLEIFVKTAFEFSKSKSPKARLIDKNDTFNNQDFQRNSEEVAALIDIYFNEIGDEYNDCLILMSYFFTEVFKLQLSVEDIEMRVKINWEGEIKKFNSINEKLGDKPKQIIDKIKGEIVKFRNNNLN